MALSFPLDVFLHIFLYISVEDILVLRQTCKSMMAVTRSKSVWHLVLQTQVLASNIPIPGLSEDSVDLFDAAELERCVRRALHLHRTWSSPSPIPCRRLELLPRPEERSRVVGMHFLPGLGRHLLLSINMNLETTGAKFTLRCWDVEASSPVMVAQRSFEQYSSLVVNTNPQDPAHIALQCPHLEIYSVDLVSRDPDSAFILLAAFPSRRGRSYAFSTDKIMSSTIDGTMCIWDINNPENDVQLSNPTVPQVAECLSAILYQDVSVVLRNTTLEIYNMSSLGLPGQKPRPTVLSPVLQHKWQWRIEGATIETQVPWESTKSGRLPPIHILIRFGSWFPWPVNILHHFTLQPNYSYDPNSGMDATNAPYLMPPTNTQSIAAPVRLFSITHMVLGQNGTALWIDSHTEDYYGHADHGQRLAGRILIDSQQSEEVGEITDAVDQVPPTSIASMVYDVHEDDTWVRLAMDETKGRIAVGSVNGEITLYQYA